MFKHDVSKPMSRVCWLALLSASSLALASCSPGHGYNGGVDASRPGDTGTTTGDAPNLSLTGKALFDQLLSASNNQQRTGWAPIVRIVSPLADSAIAPGVATTAN